MIDFSVTKVMGILNVTPDSFYDGGRYNDPVKAYDRAARMVDDGADIIDIGGESTRPGSESVTVEEEMERVLPVVQRVRSLGTVISVDTTKSAVAKEAVKAGASIINDVSGMVLDPEMTKIAAECGAYAVLMHMRGVPKTMQSNTGYTDLINDVKTFLSDRISVAINAGIKKERIIIDPGIGFGKELEDNYRLINALPLFRGMGYPVLIGLSRKSLLGRIYPADADRLPGTIALNCISAFLGAAIVRVHDVREHVLALKALAMLNNCR